MAISARKVSAVVQAIGVPSPAGVGGCQDGSGVHELSEVGGEPGGGRAVDDVVVDGDGEVEDVSHLDAVADSGDVRSLRRRR